MMMTLMMIKLVKIFDVYHIDDDDDEDWKANSERGDINIFTIVIIINIRIYYHCHDLCHYCLSFHDHHDHLTSTGQLVQEGGQGRN